MSSIIPGYEYDIFISYRQKDNKHDGWVTEFVEHLKAELESTFKEDISVYFDVSPHDGLLETHDVDASLKDKLKCLVFIPIISRTYCDPKSFAWEHEFKAFVDQASHERFGLRIKLSNGNVTSRVLPVRIHDLEEDDIKLCESILGGVLRGIEFIYQSAGVNRPLQPKEQFPNENLNHTNYRDQLNKVANTIRDVIQGMVANKALDKKEKDTVDIKDNYKSEEKNTVSRKPIKSKTYQTLLLASVFVLFAIGAILGFTKIFRSSKMGKLNPKLEKSIAVLPFRNDSPDSTNVYFINGLMEAILDNLAKIKDLKVVSRNSVEQYRNNRTKTIPQIAKELGVNFIVEGSGQKSDNQLMLSIQLLEAASDKHLYSERYNRKLENIFTIQSEVATALATKIEAIITPEEAEIINKPATTNVKALTAYSHGEDLHFKSLMENNIKFDLEAARFFKTAIQLDSTYSDAYVQMGWITGLLKSDSALYYANRALHFNPKNAAAYGLRGNYYYIMSMTKEAEEDWIKALKVKPNYSSPHRFLGMLYRRNNDFYNAIDQLSTALQLDNNSIQKKNNYISIFQSLFNLGLYDEGEKMAQKLIELSNDSSYYFQVKLHKALNKDTFESLYHSAMKIRRKDTLNIIYNSNAIAFAIYSKKYKEAYELVSRYKKFRDQLNGEFLPNYWVGFVALQLGFNKEADFHLNGLIKQSKHVIELNKDPVSVCYAYYYLCATYSALGEKANALSYLRNAKECKKRRISMNEIIELRYGPLFDLIRMEPEFKELLKDDEINLERERVKVQKLLKERGII